MDDFTDNDQEEYIADQHALKPQDWVDSPYVMTDEVAELLKVTYEFIYDPNDATTQIVNPEYTKLQESIEKNPLYKGRWAPPKVKNPNYVEYSVTGAFKEDIFALGVVVKTQTQGILIDDIKLSVDSFEMT